MTDEQLSRLVRPLERIAAALERRAGGGPAETYTDEERSLGERTYRFLTTNYPAALAATGLDQRHFGAFGRKIKETGEPPEDVARGLLRYFKRVREDWMVRAPSLATLVRHFDSWAAQALTEE